MVWSSNCDLLLRYKDIICPTFIFCQETAIIQLNAPIRNPSHHYPQKFKTNKASPPSIIQTQITMPSPIANLPQVWLISANNATSQCNTDLIILTRTCHPNPHLTMPLWQDQIPNPRNQEQGPRCFTNLFNF